MDSRIRRFISVCASIHEHTYERFKLRRLFPAKQVRWVCYFLQARKFRPIPAISVDEIALISLPQAAATSRLAVPHR
jgi:hypothetical protein